MLTWMVRKEADVCRCLSVVSPTLISRPHAIPIASADLKASTSSNGSQNKAKKSPPKTQAAAELQSMIDSMDAEAKQKVGSLGVKW